MVRVDLAVFGVDEVQRHLLRADKAVNLPLRPLLDLVGATWTSTFRDYIRSEGPPGVRWPNLHPVTVKIRKYYGHGSGPKLIRRGDLLESIRTLSTGGDQVEVGTRSSYAAVLHKGGKITSGGARRTVQAFPFIVLTDELVQDTLDHVQSYFKVR